MQIHPLRLLRALAAGAAIAASLAVATPLHAAADLQLAVPVVSQQNGAWAGAPLGGSATDTVGSSGCAVTALSMLLDYYGVPTDPGRLNAWLTAAGGYVNDDDVIWDAINFYTGERVTWSGWNGADLGVIRQELDAGRPVIAEVSLNGNEHFVIITGANDRGLVINDPWFADTVAFSDRYGDPSTGIVSIRTYVPAQPPQLRPSRAAVASPASDGPPERQAQ